MSVMRHPGKKEIVTALRRLCFLDISSVCHRRCLTNGRKVSAAVISYLPQGGAASGTMSSSPVRLKRDVFGARRPSRRRCNACPRRARYSRFDYQLYHGRSASITPALKMETGSSATASPRLYDRSREPRRDRMVSHQSVRPVNGMLCCVRLETGAAWHDRRSWRDHARGRHHGRSQARRRWQSGRAARR